MKQNAKRSWVQGAILWISIGSLTGGFLAAAEAGQPAPSRGVARNVLVNEGVVLLARAGYSEAFIIDIIHLKQTRFDVTPEALAKLAAEGLSERIVRVMVANARKEEQIAIIPATVSVVEETRVGGVTVPRSVRVVPSAADWSPSAAVPVVFPAPLASGASWQPIDWRQERWQEMPRASAERSGNKR